MFGYNRRREGVTLGERRTTLMVVIERSLASYGAAVGGVCADERPPCEKLCEENALGDHRRAADSW
jgi:hypothetical protein